MTKENKIYDRNNEQINYGDKVYDGYGAATLETHYGDIYICGNRDMWKIEQFKLEAFNDGYKLVDFVKVL